MGGQTDMGMIPQTLDTSSAAGADTYYSIDPVTMTVQPALPGQLEAVAAQLAQGYGGDPAAYREHMSFYSPVTVSNFTQAHAQGGGSSGNTGGGAFGALLDRPDGVDFNTYAYASGASRQDPASMNAYQDYLRSKGLLGQTGTTQPAYMPPNQ